MMTKSDFQMIADSFNVMVSNLRMLADAAREGAWEDSITVPKSITLETMAYDLAQRFASTNPRFNHTTFYKACGFEIRGNWPCVFPERL